MHNSNQQLMHWALMSQNFNDVDDALLRVPMTTAWLSSQGRGCMMHDFVSSYCFVCVFSLSFCSRCNSQITKWGHLCKGVGWVYISGSLFCPHFLSIPRQKTSFCLFSLFIFIVDKCCNLFHLTWCPVPLYFATLELVVTDVHFCTSLVTP